MSVKIFTSKGIKSGLGKKSAKFMAFGTDKWRRSEYHFIEHLHLVYDIVLCVVINFNSYGDLHEILKIYILGAIIVFKSETKFTIYMSVFSFSIHYPDWQHDKYAFKVDISLISS